MIDVDDRSDVRVLTLDRSEKRDARSPAGLEALEAAVRDPPRRVSVRCRRGVLCGCANLESVAAFVRRSQRAATRSRKAHPSSFVGERTDLL